MNDSGVHSSYDSSFMRKFGQSAERLSDLLQEIAKIQESLEYKVIPDFVESFSEVGEKIAGLNERVATPSKQEPSKI